MEESECFRSRLEQSSSSCCCCSSQHGGHTRVMQGRMEMAGSVKKGEMIVPDFGSCQGECLKRGTLGFPSRLGWATALVPHLARTIALRTASARIAEKG
jgi:hypothetical protein